MLQRELCMTSMLPVDVCSAQRRARLVPLYWVVRELLPLPDLWSRMAFLLDCIEHCCAVVNGISLPLLCLVDNK